MTKLLASSLALILAASGAQAIELVGANVGLSYGKITEAPNNAFEKTQLEGSAEFAIAPSISVQGDLAFSALTRANRDAESYGLHAIYDTNADLVLGAFAAYDDVQGYDVNLYGIEARGQFAGFDVETYAGRIDNDVKMGEVFGAWAQYDVTADVALGLRYDNANLFSTRTERAALTADYKAIENVAFTAEVGKSRMNNQAADAYATVGVKYTFGGKDATFNQRSLLSIVPGL